MKSRIDEALSVFCEGYNCCQAVFATYADIFGIEKELALKLASPMGAGIGRMREVCGTVSAMALLAGLKEGNTDPKDEKAKTAIYETVRRMSDAFKETQGSIVCRELLGILSREKSAAPEARTDEYYAKRPCCKLVKRAAYLVEHDLLQEYFAKADDYTEENQEAGGIS